MSGGAPPPCLAVLYSYFFFFCCCCWEGEGRRNGEALPTAESDPEVEEEDGRVGFAQNYIVT